MNIKEIKKLDGYEVSETEGGYVIRNNNFQTKTTLTKAEADKLNLKELIKITNQGKNIEHITRVTGYFSKTKSWNKGKIAELEQRFRSGDMRT